MRVKKKIVYAPYGVLYHIEKAGEKLIGGSYFFKHKVFGFEVEMRGLKHGQKRKKSEYIFSD